MRAHQAIDKSAPSMCCPPGARPLSGLMVCMGQTELLLLWLLLFETVFLCMTALAILELAL